MIFLNISNRQDEKPYLRYLGVSRIDGNYIYEVLIDKIEKDPDMFLCTFLGCKLDNLIVAEELYIKDLKK